MMNLLVTVILGFGVSAYAFDMPQMPAAPVMPKVAAPAAPTMPSVPTMPAVPAASAGSGTTVKAVKEKVVKVIKSKMPKSLGQKPNLTPPAVPAAPANLDQAKKLLGN